MVVFVFTYLLAGLESRAGPTFKKLLHSVRGQSVLLYHGGADIRIVLEMRRHQAHHHGPRQIQEDTVRLLLRRVLSKGRRGELYEVHQRHSSGRQNHSNGLGRRFHRG